MSTGPLAGGGASLRGLLVSVAVLWAAVLFAALSSLGRAVVPGLDEGVYLYAAKLMADGRLPYRDFFLSHPPWTMAAASLVLSAVGWSIPAFNALYTAWCLTPVFPIAHTAHALTLRRTPALAAAVLFLSCPELLRWDVRFFALRQASLPFLAFALWALWVKRRPGPAGVLLGLFGAGLVPHAVLAVLAGAAAAVSLRRDGDSAGARRLLLALGATLAAAYLPLLLVPGGAEALLGFQLSRVRLPAGVRLARFLGDTLPGNAPILLAGLAGSCLLPARARPLAVLNLVGLPVVLLLPASWYPHYVSSFVPALALSAAVLLGVAAERLPRAGRLAAPALAAASLVLGVVALWEPWTRTTPSELAAIRTLERAPEPLLSFEPIYALYARRELTFHRHVADMRSFRVSGLPALDDATFLEVLSRSRSVLVERSLARSLTPARTEALRRDFVAVHAGPSHVVLVRRDATPPDPPGPVSSPP